MQSNTIRIPEDDITDLASKAEMYLSSPSSKAAESATSQSSGIFSYASPVVGGKASEPGNSAPRHGLLAKLAISNTTVLTPERHAILFNSVRGLAVGEATGELFVEPLGYLDLAQRKKESRLVGADADRFSELVRAKALTSVFVAASFIASKTEGDAGGASSVDIDIDLSSTVEALKGLASVICNAVADRKDDELGSSLLKALKAVVVWAEHQSNRVMGNYRAEFENKSFTVESDRFTVHGFRASSGKKAKPALEMQFKKPTEVIGNHVAKSQAMRLAKMLASFDFNQRENPFVRLGGFTYTIMGDGFPGTGKTTLIQMVCGLIKQYCDVAGYPYHFENFGVDQISEYQGKSGQNAKAFIERVSDPRSIAFGTIDDIDQVAGRRDDSRSSGGQQEVTAVLMDAFAGAGTIVRGNCSFGMFSNYPEKVDDALRQRAGARWLVDGPQTLEDYIDIFHLLIGNDHDVKLGDHKPFASQGIKEMASKAYERHSLPQEEGLAEVFANFVQRNGEPRTIKDVGAYLHAIREKDARFTGRAIKNIADAIKNRSMDIDLPDEWFEKPETYLHKPFETKCGMLKELRIPITLDMIMQEINRYADSEFRYSAKSDDAEIDNIVRRYLLQKKAEKRIGGVDV